jgi:hypothetical protein
MPPLPSIDVMQLPTLHRSFSDAPIGTLLQVRSSSLGVIVGMHCLEGDVHGVLFLEGDQAGTMAFQNQVDRGAMDVTDLVTITVQEPAPQPATTDFKIGRLYLETATREIFMWSKLVNTGWVSIVDPKNARRGHLLGALRQDLLIDLGTAKIEPKL